MKLTPYPEKHSMPQAGNNGCIHHYKHMRFEVKDFTRKSTGEKLVNRKVEYMRCTRCGYVRPFDRGTAKYVNTPYGKQLV